MRFVLIQVFASRLTLPVPKRVTWLPELSTRSALTPGHRPHGERTFCSAQTRYDYVIVAPAALPAAAGNRLSADSTSGASDRGGAGQGRLGSGSGIPVGYLSASQSPHRLVLQTGARSGLQWPVGLSTRAARCWAAARSINAMIYMRGQAADYERVALPDR